MAFHDSYKDCEFIINSQRAFPGDLVLKNLPANAGLISESGRCPREGNGNLLQYSCQENSMDRGAWRAIVHGDMTERLSLHFTPVSCIDC